MSVITDGFELLLDAQEEACGERLLATVGVVANKDAIVEEITYDEIIAAGGVGESGGYRLQMRKSDLIPAAGANPTALKGLDAAAKGVALQVLSAVEIHGIIQLEIGDLANE